MLTTEEVAERLGVSTSRVRQFVAEDRLQGEKSGRTMLFAEDVVSQFEAQRRAPGRRLAGHARGQVKTVDEQPAALFPAAPAEVKVPVRAPSAPGQGSEVERLRVENAELRQDLAQARALVDALLAGSESLNKLAGALRHTVHRSK